MMDRTVKIILPAYRLIGRTVTKVTGSVKYVVAREIKIYGTGANIEVDKDTIFLIKKDQPNSINCIPIERELLWETTYEELHEFLTEVLRGPVC